MPDGQPKQRADGAPPKRLRRGFEKSQHRAAALQAVAIGRPPSQIEGDGLDVRSAGAELGLQALGKQAVPKVGAVFHVQGADDHLKPQARRRPRLPTRY